MFRYIVLGLNAISILLFMLIVTEAIRPRGDEVKIFLLVMLAVTPLLNFIYIIKGGVGRKIEISDSIVALWWKRKKLEEKKRIKELEG
ncbi:hypothetical protein [Serratia fonticola]